LTLIDRVREWRIDRITDRVYTTAPEARGTPAAPYPLATRGHEPWAQLLYAR